MCALQTLPPNLKVEVGRTEMQRQLGNAVPSLIAEVLGREIRSQFLDSELQDTLKLLPRKSKVVLEPEEVEPLKQEYFHLIGKHESHPGTGKGREAVRRRLEKQDEEASLNKS